jgi:hypothetical protein
MNQIQSPTHIKFQSNRLTKYYLFSISNIEIKSLQSITFGKYFNQSLDNVVFPKSLQSITFGYWFNQSLDKAVLPKSLQSITFGDRFNQSLDNVVFPKSLQSITFDYSFNQSLDNVVFPKSLQSITFGHCFNQPLDNVVFPKSLQSITFGKSFNQSLDNVVFPNSLDSITFGWNFNQPLDNLPNTITTLTFDIIRMKLNNLPICLETIKIKNHDCNSIKNIIKLPYGCKIIHNDEIKYCNCDSNCDSIGYYVFRRWEHKLGGQCNSTDYDSYEQEYIDNNNIKFQIEQSCTKLDRKQYKCIKQNKKLYTSGKSNKCRNKINVWTSSFRRK